MFWAFRSFSFTKEKMMFWPFRRRTRRPAPQLRPYARPTLVNLEGRDLLSVSVTPFIDPSSGAAALRIIEDGRNDTVTITDNSTAQTTTVLADGQAQILDQQLAVFDLELV